MSNETDDGWPAYLMAAMQARGIHSPADLSREAGIDQTQISRWLRGMGQPSIDNLRRLAPALRKPLLELMVKAGHVTREEARLRDAAATPSGSELIDVAEAIRSDANLVEEARAHLLAQYDLLRRIPPVSDRRDREDATTRPLRAVARKRPNRRRGV